MFTESRSEIEEVNALGERCNIQYSKMWQFSPSYLNLAIFAIAYSTYVIGGHEMLRFFLSDD